ncbi:hypothetical protein C8R44DRAFT_826532 [Mycena epipterygia]|nr:hypothetical protein C8R44DRAFT_826532 [Mycena epipterygia]
MAGWRAHVPGVRYPRGHRQGPRRIPRQKYIDAAHTMNLKKTFVDYNKTLLIADPRWMGPKKFGPGGAHARKQKS